MTRAGIHTKLAAASLQGMVEAYPGAKVIHTRWGGIYSVVAYEEGIDVIWAPNCYAGTVNVSMAIFSPRSTPPAREKLTQVNDIELTTVKSKGQRKVIALLRVQDDRGLAAEGATITSRCLLSDGSAWLLRT